MQDTPETPGAGGTDPGATSPQPAASPAPGAATRPTGTAGRKGLVNRVRDILTRPAEEWAVIDAEPATVGSLFVPYALILAAIPPVAMVLSVLLFAGMFANFVMGYAVQAALAIYLLFLGVTFVLGLTIDALAPNFGGTKNNVQAMKLAVYGSTPFWVAGALLLLLFSAPIIFWLWFLGGFGYGAYLLFLGVPRLMRVPADKAQVYAGAVIGAWFILLFIARILAGAMAGGPF